MAKIPAVEVWYFIQYDGTNGQEIYDATFADSHPSSFTEAGGVLTIETQICGTITVNTSDWCRVRPTDLGVYDDASFRAVFSPVADLQGLTD